MVEGAFPEKHVKPITNICHHELHARPPKLQKPALSEHTLNNAFDEALHESEEGYHPFYIQDDQLEEAPIVYLNRTAILRISALKPKLASLASTKLGPTFAMSKDGRLVFAEVSNSEKEPLLKAAMASPMSITMQFKCNDHECLMPCYLATEIEVIKHEHEQGIAGDAPKFGHPRLTFALPDDLIHKDIGCLLLCLDVKWAKAWRALSGFSLD
ncbi:hypothetical protein L0F63_004639 [Massospora cicadina]|nr:hypothetical protein L0F63_004639 [Massospora cicadina]